MRIKILSGNLAGTYDDVSVTEAETVVATGFAEYAPLVTEVSDAAPAPAEADRRASGPTLEEWVKAGYHADHYPPRGYDEQPSPGLEAFRAGQAANAKAAAEQAAQIAAEAEHAATTAAEAERAAEAAAAAADAQKTQS